MNEWINESMNESMNTQTSTKYPKRNTYTCAHQPASLEESWSGLLWRYNWLRPLAMRLNSISILVPSWHSGSSPNTRSIRLVFLEGWPPSWARARQILGCSETPTSIITTLLSLGNPWRFSLPLWSWDRNILMFRMLEMTCIPGDRETTCLH